MNLWCDLDNFQVLEPISGHKTSVARTVNLYSYYLRFRGNIMCTTGPNDNFWSTETTGMDTDGYDMPNGSSFALSLVLGNRGCCRSALGQNEELDFFEYHIGRY